MKFHVFKTSDHLLNKIDIWYDI